MLQYDRIDVSERIESKQYMLCHYRYFNNVNYKFQPYVCNDCHAVSMMACELRNIAKLNAGGVDYRCTLWGISKNDAVERSNNSVLENNGVL